MTSIDSTARQACPRAAFFTMRFLVTAALALALWPSVRAQEVLLPGRATTAPAAAPATPRSSEEPVAARAAARARWKDSLSDFAKADQAHYPANDGVLFVGSSTIRMWPHLADDFIEQPGLINRGFGGSTLADCSTLAHELVIQYRPLQVLLYAGDNDLAEGRSPAEVLESFASFVRRVRAELPNSRIDYIAIKPSPSRLSLLPRMRQTNALIANYAQTLADVRYIDIFTPMLNAQGLPRPELFRADRLHLNAAGYQLWQSVIGAYLLSPVPTQAIVRSSP